MFNVTNYKKFLLSITVLALVCVKLIFPYLSTQLLTGHDIEVHGVRLANYYLAIKQGQFPPQWAPNMNHGFGYPVFIYSYQLPYFISSFFFAVTNSIEVSLNLLGILSVLLAISGMYFLSLKVQKNFQIALLATLLYVLSPYYLLTLTIRGAIAELLFLSLLPWAIAFVTKTRPHVIDSFCIFVTTTALITSHHISLLLALPLLFAWSMYQGSTTKQLKNTSMYVGLPLIFSVVATGFYWIPALLETNLTEVSGSTFTELSQHFIRATDLVWMVWDCGSYCYIWQQRPVPTFLGPAIVTLLYFSILVLWKNRKTKQLENKNENFFWIVTSLISIVFILPLSFPIWKATKLIAMIEFPWLLLWVPTLGTVMTLLFSTSALKLTKKSDILLVSLIIAQSLYAYFFWTTPRGHFSKSLEDWLQFGDITQNYDGLLPKGFDSHKNLRLVEPLVVRADNTLAFATTGQSKPTQAGTTSISTWTGTDMVYTVESTSSGSILQKTAYFPGWHATVDSKEVEIVHTDAEFPGRILIPVKPGKHEVHVYYTGTTLPRVLGKYSSLLGIAAFLFYICVLYFTNSKRKV